MDTGPVQLGRVRRADRPDDRRLHRLIGRSTPPPSDGPVVIVASPSDSHATAVARVLARDFDREAIVWDTSAAAAGEPLTFSLGSDGTGLVCGERIELEEVASIWWRRPQGFGLDRYGLSPEVLQYCKREYSSLLHGALDAGRAPVVNAPAAEAVAQRKPYQLALARRHGLPVPDTVISNDPVALREFWEAHDRDCVYKTLTPTPGVFRETRRLTSADLQDLALVALAPVIVQQRLGGADVRVTVVGAEQFAAVVHPSHPAAATDWRVDLSCRWEPFDLDPRVGQRLRSLLTALGLHYGCVDLRLADDGTPHFLEVNPSGQFLFVQVDTAQPIVEAMCALLVDPPPVTTWATPAPAPDRRDSSSGPG